MESSKKNTVGEMAEKLYPLNKIMDRNGIVRGFRKFLWMDKIGITDVKGETVIVQAKYPEIIVSARYAVFIAGGKHLGWEILSLEGKPLYPNIRFKTLEEISNELEKTIKPN